MFQGRLKEIEKRLYALFSILKAIAEDDDDSYTKKVSQLKSHEIIQILLKYCVKRGRAKK